MFPLTFKSTVKTLLALALICSVNIKDMPGAIYHTLLTWDVVFIAIIKLGLSKDTVKK